MFKLTPRYTLWSRAVWTSYALIGVILFFTDTMNHNTILAAQLALYGFLALPGYNRRLDDWLNQPRIEQLRVLGRLFTA